MTPVRLPSLDVPEEEKRRFTEADVHAKLFEPDMAALGYPLREATQAAGEHFKEQATLALRRLKSKSGTGRYDGLYLIGNSPVVLCEIKRYDALDADGDLQRAKEQVIGYALSEDFAEPPPFLVLYCGKLDRTRFFVRKTLAEHTEYEELQDVWSWSRVKEFQLRGEFALEIVDHDRLREILLYHLDRIEDSLRVQVNQAIQVVKGSPGLVGDFGKWLLERPEALNRMRALYERKVAEVGKDSEPKVAGEMVTQAALNYLNKVFFLSLCEDRHLPGFYRIMREFLPRAKAETGPETAAAFLGLLRRRIKDSAATWDPEDEEAYDASSRRTSSRTSSSRTAGASSSRSRSTSPPSTSRSCTARTPTTTSDPRRTPSRS